MGKRPGVYTTRQGEAILAFLSSCQGAHVTAAQVAEHFNDISEPIGRTTVYRRLEKLVAEGMARKYIIDESKAACYQYVDEPQQGHYHLKCEVCGEVFHLCCNLLDEVADHIYDEHDFKVNEFKTVFYGVCADCREQN
ncbi:MAG: transcriptional repressor [Clostridiales bacterium]|nr:transcriptional repressor [Clostridiales bacterium]